jgi:hypothetical protein
MKKPTIFILFVLVIVGLASLLLAFPQGNRCHPTGVWTAVWEVAPGMHWYFTINISPEDPNTKRSTHILKWMNADPTLGNAFPDADFRSDFVGERIRTGKDTWKCVFIGYAVNKAAGELVYVMTYDAIETLTNNCNTLEVTGTYAIYIPAFDPDWDNNRDGYPDETAIVFDSGSYQGTAQRIPMTND